jgi:uncharacterized protein YdhG (YjbR/CyaY superfamily)
MAQSPPETFAEYAALYPKNVQTILRRMRNIIKEAAPEATEKISYGVPTFFLNGNLVHFGAFKSHIGFYPGPGAIALFAEDLAAYKSAKGSVQFPFDEPLPAAIVTRMVKFRVKENLAKKKRK